MVAPVHNLGAALIKLASCPGRQNNSPRALKWQGKSVTQKGLSIGRASLLAAQAERSFSFWIHYFAFSKASRSIVTNS